jgi:hypothetical protein
VVASRTGDIEEIHVLTESSLAPKNVVRDVESALMAQFGMELDHKKVSVAQTQDGKRFRYDLGRLKFSEVAISLNGSRAEATVHLKKDDEIYTGTSMGHSSARSQLRLIATATLRAVENVEGADGTMVLEDVHAGVALSDRSVAVVLVNMVTQRGEDQLVGSAIVKQDLWKAVVNATLDAVNRRLGLIGED